MKKSKDPKQEKFSKNEGRAIKEIVPPLSLGKTAREHYIRKIPENYDRNYKCANQPNEFFKEWPGNQEANSYDFFNSNDDVFSDPFIINMPRSNYTELNYECKWYRIENYIRDKRLHAELKRILPTEKLINKTLMRIRNMYNKKDKALHSRKWSGMFKKKETTTIEDELIDNENEEDNKSKIDFSNSMANSLANSVGDGSLDFKSDEKKEKNNRYKEIFKFYSDPLNIKVVEFIERDETEDEVKRRKEILENEEKIKADQMKSDKKKITNRTSLNIKKIENVVEQVQKVKEVRPGNLILDRCLTRYYRWVSSHLQAIKDQNILDVNVSN